MYAMADIILRKKTLKELSVDNANFKGNSNAYVTDSTVEAIDFDNFAADRCKDWHIPKLRSCDALLINQTSKYLIEFKNRPLRDQYQSGHTPESDERLLKTEDGRKEFNRCFAMQSKLELELFEKLYESLIMMNGADGEVSSHLVEDRDTLTAIIAVSSQKNSAIRSYNDHQHPNFYSLAFGQGDPVFDNIVMGNLNRSIAEEDFERNPEHNIDIYDDWFCPRHLKKLEGTLFRKVLFMTGTQLKQFLRIEGFSENNYPPSTLLN